MDNFVISAKTRKELEERTIHFLKMAKKHILYFKWSKCDFNTKESPILGVVVRWGEVQMENNKIKAIKKWKTLTKTKEVESSLGFVNFYWHFIKNFSHTVKSLNELKGKKEWKWKEKYQKAFEELMNKITGQLILVLPKRKGKFRVETDVSEHAIKGVLF